MPSFWSVQRTSNGKLLLGLLFSLAAVWGLGNPAHAQSVGGSYSVEISSSDRVLEFIDDPIKGPLVQEEESVLELVFL